MIKSKLPGIPTTIFTTMSALAAKHNAVNLSQGFPDFEIDPKLGDLVNKAILAEKVQYAPMPGTIELRTAIANQIQKQRNVTISPEDEITITAGATQAIFTTISAVINQGDEVLVFDPAYDCYAPTVKIYGGKPVHLKLKHPNYTVDWNEVEASISAKTKMIIVNNPHNPTGATFTRADIEALEIIVKNNPHLIVLSDEVYEHIQFKGKHCSVLDSEILRKQSFVTYSFGKTLHATGWKLGYCIAPKDFTKEFRSIHQYLVFAVNSTMQYAVSDYLNNYFDRSKIAKSYQKRKEFFLNEIADSRFEILPCNGTYFCLLGYEGISDMGDVDFAKYLTEEKGIATIPTSVFYQDKTDHKVIRVCFAKKEETLRKAAEILCKI